MLLIDGDLTPLLGNVLPVQRIQITALLVVACILLVPTLKFLNIEFSFLLDTGHVSVGTDDDILAVNKLQPWMGVAAAKSIGRPTVFLVVAWRCITVVLLECLL